MPKIVKDKRPRWRVLGIKWLKGTGFSTEKDARQAMIQFQLMELFPPSKYSQHVRVDIAIDIIKNHQKITALLAQL